MTAELHIRPWTPFDVPEVVAVERASFDAPWAPGSFEAELANPLGRGLVAVNGRGDVVGFALYWHVFDEFHVMNVAVRPDARRGGVGRALVAEVLRRAAAAGGGAVHLEVRVSNEAAIRLYTAAGFTPVGLRPHYYSDGEDARLMTCLVGPADRSSAGDGA